jgi:hypothetical protein
MNRASSCRHKSVAVVDNQATLRCPRTEDIGEPYTVQSRPAAYWKAERKATQLLYKVVGEAACNGCPYFAMSPSEVHEEKGRVASAQAMRIMGENELLKAQAEREALLRTLGDSALEPSAIPPLPAPEALPPAAAPQDIQ